MVQIWWFKTLSLNLFRRQSLAFSIYNYLWYFLTLLFISHILHPSGPPLFQEMLHRVIILFRNLTRTHFNVNIFNFAHNIQDISTFVFCPYLTRHERLLRIRMPTANFSLACKLYIIAHQARYARKTSYSMFTAVFVQKCCNALSVTKFQFVKTLVGVFSCF